jgi:hypothetical protein
LHLLGFHTQDHPSFSLATTLTSRVGTWTMSVIWLFVWNRGPRKTYSVNIHSAGKNMSECIVIFKANCVKPILSLFFTNETFIWCFMYVVLIFWYDAHFEFLLVVCSYIFWFHWISSHIFWVLKFL